MRIEDGARRVPVWLVVVVLLSFVPAATLAMTIGLVLGAAGTPAGSGGANCPGVNPGKYLTYFQEVLQGIRAPVSDDHVTVLAVWHAAEGGSATWNPLNTTQPGPGSTNYNSVGVKNYPSERVGVTATVKTLLNGHYPQILAALRQGTADVHAVAGAVDGSVWGTKHMSDVAARCSSSGAQFDVSGCPSFGHGTPWGGFSNGEIPEQGPAMVPLPGAMNGSWLRCDAAKSLIAMSADYKKAFGRDISVTQGYRTLAEQRYLYATKPPGVAAVPGTSNHGWGCAVDLGGGVNAFGSAQFRWMKSHADHFGWVHPSWAESSPFEPWHWEFQSCSGATPA